MILWLGETGKQYWLAQSGGKATDCGKSAIAGALARRAGLGAPPLRPAAPWPIKRFS